MKRILFTFTALLILNGGFLSKVFALEYSWLENYNPTQTIEQRIPTPKGYERVPVPAGSFQEWLRKLPLKPEGAEVLLFNGDKKSRQNLHVAVVDLDVGTQDLQQCADAVMRLRAEYLNSQQRYEAIHFNFTSGDRASFQQWSQGYRPKIKGNQVRWQKTKAPSSSYHSLRRYLNSVFMYAGSYSLEKELKSVAALDKMHIGDIFIQGGFPGHAVIVVDMAQHTRDGQKIFMLAQSYMPAQDVHVLKNPSKWRSTPWYDLDFEQELRTPEWTFQQDDLKRFPER